MVRAASLTTLANGVGFLGRFLAQVAVIRILAGYGGDAYYGLVATLQTIAVAQLAVDLGVVTAVKNRLVGTPDRLARVAVIRDARRLLTMVSAALAVVAGFAILLGLPDALHDERVAPRGTALMCFGLLVCSSLQLPHLLPRAILGAEQQEYRLWGLSLAGPLGGAGLTWLCAHFDAGLIITTLAMPAMLLLSQALGWCLIPQDSKVGDRSEIRPLLREGLPYFIIQLAGIGISQCSVPLVNSLFGNAAAGRFAIHYQLFMWLGVGIGLMVGPYWSPVREAFLMRDPERIRRIVRVLLGVVLCGSLMGSFALYILGERLVGVISKGVFVWDPWLSMTLSAYAVITAVYSVGGMMLGACGVVRGPMTLIVVQGLLALALGYAGGLWLGPPGVVAGGIAAYLCTSCWYVPRQMHLLLKGLRP